MRWKEAKGQPNPADEAKLTRAIRAHSNFAEGTPFAFFLLFLAELNGAPTSLVHGGFLSLFLGRVAHGSFGIMDDTTAALGRPIGFILTYGITVAAGLYNVSEDLPDRIGVESFGCQTASLTPLMPPFPLLPFMRASPGTQLNLGYEPLKSFLGFK